MINVVIMKKIVQTNPAKKEPLNAQRIASWLQAEGFTVENQEENIVAVTELGTKLVIDVDTERDFIKYYCIFSFKTEAQDEEKKLHLVNDLNAKVIFSRFSMPKPEILFSDYFIMLRNMNKKSLSRSLRLFESVTLNAIRQYDKNDLIQ